MAHKKKHSGHHTGKVHHGHSHLKSEGKEHSSGSHGHSVEKGHHSHEMESMATGYSPGEHYEGTEDSANSHCSE